VKVKFSEFQSLAVMTSTLHGWREAAITNIAIVSARRCRLLHLSRSHVRISGNTDDVDAVIRQAVLVFEDVTEMPLRR